MLKKVLAGYADAAPDLITRFESISSDELFRPVQDVLPKSPNKVLDIGAGSGRDAAWFAAQGSIVVAVEPVAELREAGAALHKSANIKWLDDALPELPKTRARGDTFNLVMLSGVWQHLDRTMREIAIKNISRLTGAGGMLFISVRDGPGTPSRPVFPADIDHTIELAKRENFQLQLRQSVPSIQQANRDAGVMWTWLAFSAFV